MLEKDDKSTEKPSIQDGVIFVVDHLRLMGVIAKESLTHPTVQSTILYNRQTREIKVKREVPQRPA
jgi:hypothetical protein